MNWRLIEDDAAPGAWNMAVDEAMLLGHADNLAPPTVRFYDWSPACLSLGRFQEYCRLQVAAGVEVVRRPTGGRAVWHQHEITYSAVVREDLLPEGATSVVGAYRWLSDGLVNGLKALGVEAALARSHKSTAPRGSTPNNCFNSAAQCDFLVEGRKLIGAAQARKRGAILQHGSILLELDETMWNKMLGGEMRNSISLRALGLKASRAEIIKVLANGMEETLQHPLQSGELTPHETEMANQLHRDQRGLTVTVRGHHRLQRSGDGGGQRDRGALGFALGRQYRHDARDAVDRRKDRRAAGPEIRGTGHHDDMADRIQYVAGLLQTGDIGPVAGIGHHGQRCGPCRSSSHCIGGQAGESDRAVQFQNRKIDRHRIVARAISVMDIIGMRRRADHGPRRGGPPVTQTGQKGEPIRRYPRALIVKQAMGCRQDRRLGYQGRGAKPAAIDIQTPHRFPAATGFLGVHLAQVGILRQRGLRQNGQKQNQKKMSHASGPVVTPSV